MRRRTSHPVSHLFVLTEVLGLFPGNDPWNQIRFKRNWPYRRFPCFSLNLGSPDWYLCAMSAIIGSVILLFITVIFFFQARVLSTVLNFPNVHSELILIRRAVSHSLEILHVAWIKFILLCYFWWTNLGNTSTNSFSVFLWACANPVKDDLRLLLIRKPCWGLGCY